MVMCPDVSENTNASLRIDNLSYNGLYYQCANATAGCEHQKQRTQKQHIRVRIRIHLHKLPCRSIASIGVRTLNVSRHRSSQLAFSCKIISSELHRLFRKGICMDKTKCSYYGIIQHIIAATLHYLQFELLFPFMKTDSCKNLLQGFKRNLLRIPRIQYRFCNSQSDIQYPILPLRAAPHGEAATHLATKRRL